MTLPELLKDKALPIKVRKVKWCEDCFDAGLTKDMNDHFDNFMKQEMALLTETTSNELS